MHERDLRIGDAEREAASAALGEHLAAGRLTHEEYGERIDAVWSARTRGDLEPMFADLPRREPPREDRRVRSRRRIPVTPLVALLVGLVLLSAVTHVPIVLVALVAWLLLARGRPWGRRRRWHHAPGQASGSRRAPRGSWA